MRFLILEVFSLLSSPLLLFLTQEEATATSTTVPQSLEPVTLATTALLELSPPCHLVRKMRDRVHLGTRPTADRLTLQVIECFFNFSLLVVKLLLSTRHGESLALRARNVLQRDSQYRSTVPAMPCWLVL